MYVSFLQCEKSNSDVCDLPYNLILISFDSVVFKKMLRFILKNFLLYNSQKT